MKKDEKGMMVVEALISFTAFILVCIGIVFMIKIFMLHNRVQYAINAAARELSTYTYIYDALGLRDAERR
ncbi:MAG: pilus assembly protein, partial [Clostridia bacterium]|nr:pilus assembly protein [Clostridia bacterium]